MNETVDGRYGGASAVDIYWRGWVPEGEPRAVVVLAHGAGEHSGRYLHVAARLVSEGFALYAVDHRGHGLSGGTRALIDRIDNVVADLDQLVVIAAARHPGLPIFLLGHSMGAAISLCYTIAHQDRLAGLLLTGPLAALEAASPATLIAAKVLSALTPRLGVTAVDSKLVSRDPEVVKAYEDDPLVHHGKLPARTVAQLADVIGAFPESVRTIMIPVLIMYGSADGLCPPKGATMLAERIGSQDKSIKCYDGLFHEILNEPEQDEILDDICAWIGERVGVSSGRSGNR